MPLTVGRPTGRAGDGGCSSGGGGTRSTVSRAKTPSPRCIARLNVTLVPGHYWLNVTPVGNGTGRSFNANTSGANCVGTPCGDNQNAFFNSTFFGAYFTSTANEGQPSDYSNGVIGTVVPSPHSGILRR